jgi:hypothetical protein
VVGYGRVVHDNSCEVGGGREVGGDYDFGFLESFVLVRHGVIRPFGFHHVCERFLAVILEVPEKFRKGYFLLDRFFLASASIARSIFPE